MTRPRRKPQLDVYGRERPSVPPLFVPDPGQLDIFDADWMCRYPRSHGPCNTMNGDESPSCGACGEDRPASPPATESTSAPTEEF